MLERFVRRRTAVAGAAVLAVILLLSVSGTLFSRYGSDEFTSELSRPPSWSHPMGTDGAGRDLFARVLEGIRRSARVAALVTAVSVTVGVVLGGLAGYRRGWLDELMSRLVDLVLTIPVLAVLLVVASRAGSERSNWVVISLIISAVTWPGIFRVARASMLSIAERQFVEAARSAGASEHRVLLRHIIPNAMGPIILMATLTVVWAVIAEASLSFLGFGAATSLGALVDIAQVAASTRPWLFYFPGATLVLICLCVNLVGDGLRDALDPRDADTVGRHDRSWLPDRPM